MKAQRTDMKSNSLIRFMLLYCFSTLLDCIGTFMYLADTWFGTSVAIEVLHLRVVLLVFSFIQLRSFTFTKKKLAMAQKVSPPVPMGIPTSNPIDTDPVEIEMDKTKMLSTVLDPTI
jgi:hypothetical protein